MVRSVGKCTHSHSYTPTTAVEAAVAGAPSQFVLRNHISVSCVRVVARSLNACTLYTLFLQFISLVAACSCFVAVPLSTFSVPFAPPMHPHRLFFPFPPPFLISFLVPTHFILWSLVFVKPTRGLILVYFWCDITDGDRTDCHFNFIQNSIFPATQKSSVFEMRAGSCCLPSSLLRKTT